MFLQVFRLNPTGIACNCVLLSDYPAGTSHTKVMDDAVRDKQAVHPGIYVVTQSDLVTSIAMPFTHMLTVFTLNDDHTVVYGAQGALAIPMLASWPVKRVKSE